MAITRQGCKNSRGFQAVASEGMLCTSLLLWGVFLFPIGAGGESKLSALERLAGNPSLPVSCKKWMPLSCSQQSRYFTMSFTRCLFCFLAFQLSPDEHVKDLIFLFSIFSIPLQLSWSWTSSWNTSPADSYPYSCLLRISECLILLWPTIQGVRCTASMAFLARPLTFGCQCVLFAWCHGTFQFDSRNRIIFK